MLTKNDVLRTSPDAIILFLFCINDNKYTRKSVRIEFEFKRISKDKMAGLIYLNFNVIYRKSNYI